MELKGWSAYSSSLSIGLSEQYIHTLLSLVEAPKEVKELIEEKKIDTSGRHIEHEEARFLGIIKRSNASMMIGQGF
jgi:hypothetical protein